MSLLFSASRFSLHLIVVEIYGWGSTGIAQWVENVTLHHNEADQIKAVFSVSINTTAFVI